MTIIKTSYERFLDMKKGKRILLCFILLAAAAFVPSLSLAYQIDTFTGYLYSRSATQYASNNDIQKYNVDTDSWSLDPEYSDRGANLEWSLTSNLKTTWIDEFLGVYKTSGTLEWTVTNRGEALNHVRFFGLLDGWIDGVTDFAERTSGFLVADLSGPGVDYWEIDDALDGNILTNLNSGTLDNSVENTDTGYPSMALGFDIGTLFSDESFTASFILSEDFSTNGLYLYNDSYEDEEIYFNGLISSGPESGPAVPLPPAMILLGSGLLGLIGIGSRKKV